MASGILGPQNVNVGDTFWTLVWAGFTLAVVNIFVKPLAVFLSLPALILSVGLFMLVVNGAMVLLASRISDSLYVAGWGSAILAGIIISLLNLALTHIAKDFDRK